MATHNAILNLIGDENPPVDGVSAPIGTLFVNRDTGLLYTKVGTSDTAWSPIASQYMLPTSWFALDLVATAAFADMSVAGLTFTSSVRMMRPGRVIGISTIISGGPITAGLVGVKLKKNASPLFPEYLMDSGTLPNGGFFDLSAVDPQYTEYTTDDTLTVQVGTNGATPAGSMDIAAWLQVRE